MYNGNKVPEICMIGMNHKTAPVGIRENFSLNDENISELLQRLHSVDIKEAVCISTCNRVEVYLVSDEAWQTIEEVIKIFEEISSLSRENFESSLYKKYSIDAVHHLLSVTSSLDSMVVGENEIIGQVKDAYKQSAELKSTGQILNRLFHQAFNTAKRVRTETEIAKNPLSVAYIATELAKSIFEDLSRKKALLIGAGEMGELILKYLTKYNVNDITIANRSFHNAERIANNINIEAHIITLDDIKATTNEFDIIISSLSSPNYIITPETTRNAIKKRKNRPLFLIDISVPRSIDPEISKLDNVFLYNIDDLKSIADENLKSRLKEVELAKHLIKSDTEEFYEWYEGLAIVPIIVNIQKKFEEIREIELDKYKRKKLKHLQQDDLTIIEELTKQIMKKILHNPIMYLKSHQSNSKREDAKRDSIREIIKIVEELFKDQDVRDQ